MYADSTVSRFNGTGICEKFSMVRHGEMFVGIGDFQSNAIYGKKTYTECCQACLAKNEVVAGVAAGGGWLPGMSFRCSAFVHVGKVCWLKSLEQHVLRDATLSAIMTPDVHSGWIE
jgi:hypothetical protein